MGDQQTISSVGHCDLALGRLLGATLRLEGETAKRDAEILAIQKRYAPKLQTAGLVIGVLESQIQEFYSRHRAELEVDGKKSIQLKYGLLGMRAPSHPALEPLNQKWTWKEIGAKVKELWKSKYFHKPKPPGLNKNKLKDELTADQLKECGMKLETTESFYIELNRLAAPDEVATAEAAA